MHILTELLKILSMRIISVLLLLSLICGYAYPQKSKSKSKSKSKKDKPTWFFANVGGGYGNSILLDDHLSNSTLMPKYLNPQYGFDGNLGVNFSFGIGLSAGIGKSGFEQNYSWNNIESKINVATTDKYLLFRVLGETGTFLELGPKFSKISHAPVANSFNNFKSSHTSLLFGLGGSLYWHNNFDISMGLRLTYGFNIMEDNNYPYGAVPDINITEYSSFEQSYNFTAQLRLVVNWHIGYFKTAQCDKHVEFLMF